MELETLKALYVHELRDLYSAETQLAEFLPRVRNAAAHEELRILLQDHLEETRRHVERLDMIFDGMDESPGDAVCDGMRGLVKETKGILDSDADDHVRDAGIIAMIQRIEHYEMAGYGTARTYAELLGEDDDRTFLENTVEEEGRTDERLTRLAVEVVNPDAAKAAPTGPGTPPSGS